MLCHFDPHTTETNHLGAIHFERRKGCSANRSQPNDFCGILAPGKMIPPGLLMGVEQRDTFVSNRVWNSLTIRFQSITCWTGQAKVFEICFATSRTGHDVLDLKSRNGENLRSSAVGAAVGKDRADLPS
jgi:hypothetical protein